MPLPKQLENQFMEFVDIEYVFLKGAVLSLLH